jgi:pimeloyl-ACP methyl ester carboxylesterase
VAGLVLVDPSEERLYERGAAALQAKFGARVTSKLELADRALIGMLVDRFDQCAAKAAEADLDPASIGYKRCTDPVRPQLGPDIVAERPNVQKKAAYQAAQASELSNSVFADKTGDAAYARLFTRHMLGNKPLIVLTHGNYDAEDPEAVADNFLINRLHAETAALSRRGTHRVVPNTNHNIQVEDPQAIIQAIRDVLLAAAI